MTVRVARQSDGSIVLSPGPAASEAPAGVAVVGLPGLSALVDPTEATATPTVVVTDIETAAPLVASLYGDLAAEALIEAQPTDVPLVDLPARADLAQLGLLRWLADHRPAPLDPLLVDLESTVLWATLCDEDAPLDSPVRLARLATMARILREQPTLPLGDELRALVGRAAQVVAPLGRLDTPEAERFQHEAALLQVEARLGPSSLRGSDLAWLAEHLRPRAAASLGDAGPATCSLDWLRVPSALLPAPEDTVLFTIVAGPDPHVAVEVPAPTSPVPHLALPRVEQSPQAVVASLRSFSWPLPLAEGRLAYDPIARRWQGHLPLSLGALDLLRASDTVDVDVRSSRVPWEAPQPRRQATALARRWAARALQLRRLSTDAPAGDDVAAAGFRYAARLWAPLDLDAAERCRVLATRADHRPLTLAERWLLLSGNGPS